MVSPLRGKETKKNPIKSNKTERKWNKQKENAAFYFQYNKIKEKFKLQKLNVLFFPFYTVAFKSKVNTAYCVLWTFGVFLWISWRYRLCFWNKEKKLSSSLFGNKTKTKPTTTPLTQNSPLFVPVEKRVSWHPPWHCWWLNHFLVKPPSPAPLIKQPQPQHTHQSPAISQHPQPEEHGRHGRPGRGAEPALPPRQPSEELTQPATRGAPQSATLRLVQFHLC